MWALRVVASLWVGAARLALSCLPPVSSSFLPSSCTPSTSLSPSSLAVKLLDQYLRWAHARCQPTHAYRAAGQRFPLSRESRVCVCSPVWATCAPGSRSYMSRQAGVARPPHCKPLLRGLRGQRGCCGHRGLCHTAWSSSPAFLQSPQDFKARLTSP